MADRTLLTLEQITAAAAGVPHWNVDDKALRRTFTLATFPAAVEFVNEVARIAEEMNHHPDIDIRWRKVTLALSTHSAGGLTALDFEAARRIDGGAAAGGLWTVGRWRE